VASRLGEFRQAAAQAGNIPAFRQFPGIVDILARRGEIQAFALEMTGNAVVNTLQILLQPLMGAVEKSRCFENQTRR